MVSYTGSSDGRVGTSAVCSVFAICSFFESASEASIKSFLSLSNTSGFGTCLTSASVNCPEVSACTETSVFSLQRQWLPTSQRKTDMRTGISQPHMPHRMQIPIKIYSFFEFRCALRSVETRLEMNPVRIHFQSRILFVFIRILIGFWVPCGLRRRHSLV